MSIDQSNLNKGQIRKLNTLRKSRQNEIADTARFSYVYVSIAIHIVYAILTCT
jgi:hypothetical protein